MWRKIVGGTLIFIGRSMGKLAKMDRLDKIDTLPLLSTLDDAVALYGKPIAIENDADFPESTEYTFRLAPFHECVVWEWNGLIHCIIYFPEFSYPDPDLKFMFETYGENQEWVTINQGYLYFRKDRRVRLWCSAMPPIGVATIEYWDAKELHSASQKADNQS